jgi:UDP-N-acetylmuramoyl-L-alanyl-D-glutamate--2,6-diaminopimelate ligase
MQLKKLLTALPGASVVGSIDRDVAGIAYDSRRVQRDTLFVALRGEKTDGHQFVDQAVERGATVIVSDRELKNARATLVRVENARHALADLSAAFYNRPVNRLKMAAVTGTNGKTTTTFLLKHICEKAGLRCGLIGTVRYEICERVLPAVRTTPESLELQELLAQIANAGCKATAMEVSSHAIAQERTRGLEWDVAVFTNLTQDHLDFHGTMEAYFESKLKLFTGLAGQEKKKKAVAVVNVDDRYGAKIVERLGNEVPVVTYGMGVHADFRASNYRPEFSGTSYQLDAKGKSYLVRVPLIGASTSRTHSPHWPRKQPRHPAARRDLSLGKAPQVPGRLEAVPAKRQFQVFVDYAHTPDALLNVLKTVRELSPRKIICVFGCGGDRDRAKRPLMAHAADQKADFSIITSDNPRKEDPDAIIAKSRKASAPSATKRSPIARRPSHAR